MVSLICHCVADVYAICEFDVSVPVVLHTKRCGSVAWYTPAPTRREYEYLVALGTAPGPPLCGGDAEHFRSSKEDRSLARLSALSER